MITPYFLCEGNEPFRTGEKLTFSALASKCLTANGHGWRNELKIKQALRRDMSNTEETLTATVSFDLSNGAKTIFVQYHEASTKTLLKFYIADCESALCLNGKANDGIFDVFVRITDPVGIERTYPFITIKSGESFDFTLQNELGLVTVVVNGKKVSARAKDSENVYLKFGNYLQAQDPVTGMQETDKAKYGTFYQNHGITRDEVVFTNVTYKRK
jgi:hypothetical protein